MQAVSPERSTWEKRTHELWRERVLSAMAQTAAERGFAGASVAVLCASAGVSRSRFYELFESREACFLAVLDDGYRHASAAILRASARAGDWREGVRFGLAELLSFFDAEPQLTRVCLVESLAAGPWSLRARERHVTDLMGLILSRWETLAPPEPYLFTNAGVAASILGVVQHQIMSGKDEPVLGLLGSLVGLATAPYLDTEHIAQQVEIAEGLACALLAKRGRVPESDGETPGEIPDLLLNPKAHRLREAVRYLSGHPGASNREVATAIGVISHPQISRLLNQLKSVGLMAKRAGQPGRPNAWWLTTHGEAVARMLRA